MSDLTMREISDGLANGTIDPESLGPAWSRVDLHIKMKNALSWYADPDNVFSDDYDEKGVPGRRAREALR